jgi:quercetin dioxygenase-like cupin family protein
MTDDIHAEKSTAAKSGFAIFRGKDAPFLGETGAMPLPAIAAASMPEFERAVASGLGDGEQVRLVFSGAGVSLTHVWFKKDFPLPLHSHNAQCLYYIVAGTLRLGDKTLGKGDGFMIPSDMPYTYRAGPDGVELLEFRTAESFDFQFHSDTPSFWRKAADVCAANQEGWKAALPPLG